ncbi:aminoglycoside phosphotransferase family protein [Streptomyces triticirhizae]|uniref:Aminoglycoside phosphotransferase family protein n=1 Tax=Streptomyces triticirhizae TaxID=2483353 RepID=A0A3M2LK44_9ACTN|nr:aminoglycoside phosphotransferase family protein [Streptomyces triticirhizae]RMI37849.1 aminoglycoside phosphotransferase family protein [Streptomyces triticirhizae]
MYPAPSPVVTRHRTVLAGAPGGQRGALVDERVRRARRPGPPLPVGARLDLTGAGGERLRAALASIQRICPEFTPARVLRDGDGTVVLAGMAGRRAAVAKCVLDQGEEHRARFERELAVNRAFLRHRPPVRVPRMVGDEPRDRTLITEFVPGRAASPHRHPAIPPATSDLRATLAAVRRINAWHPPDGAFPDALNYGARLARYHMLGLLTDRDLSDLKTLLHDVRGLGRGEPPRQFCHGEALPPHVLLSPTGPVLINWRAAGWYLPGYDLATLWASLGESPLVRRQISQSAQAEGRLTRDCFLINLMLVLTREIRLCELGVRRAMARPGSASADRSGGTAPGEEKRLLLRRLHDDWSLARQAIRAAVGTR